MTINFEQDIKKKPSGLDGFFLPEEWNYLFSAALAAALAAASRLLILFWL